MNGFSDADFQNAMRRAIITGSILTAIALPLVFWKSNWQSALMLLVGAVISISGLWEWRRLMTAVAIRMEATPALDFTEEGSVKPPSLTIVFVAFFLRLGIVLGVLYVTLKYLQGSVFALAAGLIMGVIALTVEGIRLLKAWTA